MQPKLVKFSYVHHLNPLYGDTHSHPNHEYVYCVSGRGTVVVNGISHRFDTGTIYVTAAGTPHSEQDFTESEIIYFYFELPIAQFSEGVFRDKSGSVLSILRKIQNEEREKLPRGNEMKNALLTQLLIETTRTETDISDNKGISPIIKYIDENSSLKLDVHSLAKKAGYSYDRFRHIFRERTGMAPGDYIIERRVDMAKKLMENDVSASLTYIAYECGFSTSSHFSNAFRSKVGISPGEYRKRLRTEVGSKPFTD